MKIKIFEIIKNFLKPTISKIAIFFIISISIFYFLKESVCGVFLYFPFCYTTYGFPLDFAVSGDLEIASGILKASPFASYYSKTGNVLFNPAMFAIDIVLIYIAACFVAALIGILYRKYSKALKK